MMYRSCCCLIATLVLACCAAVQAAPEYREEFIFPLHPEHNHAPGIVECPNGDLLVSWYRGSGERRADDVAIYGARLKKGASHWSESFVLADNPAFPDCNTCLMIDRDEKLWLFWPIILDNNWESALTNYLVSKDYQQAGTPDWDWQGVVWLKPDDFKDKALRLFEERLGKLPAAVVQRATKYGKSLEKRLGDKLYQRLGWQPRCKPTILKNGRILLPLYSDTFSFSLMAISDDGGKTWFAGEPLIGFGNIQPAVLEREDGTLVAYMRENGPRNKIRVAESSDAGVSWGPVGVMDLPNPGSGLDAVRLANGNWVLIYNDTTRGRSSLAVSLSEDEGKTWPYTRHLEKHEQGSYHYPAIIQGADGMIHAVYSYFVKGGKSMKHAAFNEDWIKAGDAGTAAAAATPEGKRYVIIHADDAGMSHSVNRATIDAMEKGIVSSASIMVPCAWFKEIAAYAKEHPEKDFGIHLTLNCEWDNYRWGPVAPRASVPSLIDEEGYLWGGVPEVVANAKASEVETELRAQIQRALDFGVPVSHLDTHMGAVVSRPDLVEVYVKLGIEFDVPVFFIRRLNVGVAATNPQIRARGMQLVEALDKHKLPVLDYMTQYYTKGSLEKKKAMYLKAIADTEPGVRYVIIHCGYDNEELQAITTSSKLRDTDRRVFCDPEFIEAVKQTGVEIVDWKQVRRMNDKRLAAGD